MDTLLGMTAGTWWKMLRENRFAISPRYIPRAVTATFITLMNSLRRNVDHAVNGGRFDDVELQPPLFILGHWRSGTTLLHNLLSVDERWAYPTIHQVLNPRTFLTTEDVAIRYFAQRPTNTRAMDNMTITPGSPGEDEFALSAISLRSPLIAWNFPRRDEWYDRYLTLQDIPPEELQEWKDTFLWFLRKVTYKYQRPLMLKSPTHTARVRVLLDLFPEARFVHIHRNPYRVFQSTKNLYERGIPRGYLQEPPDGSVEEGIIRRYRVMYDAFFRDRELIPQGHYHEVCFEELEQDMIGQVAGIYEGLGLDGFSQVRPKLEAYVASIADYQKTSHKSLPEAIRQRLSQEWRPCFEEWGYPT
ncbi:MAG: sulfotransferase [Chloroflexi bacterium]|nr:sulfotransferase [Chloroflexota bacterium]